MKQTETKTKERGEKKPKILDFEKEQIIIGMVPILRMLSVEHLREMGYALLRVFNYDGECEKGGAA